MIAFQVICLCKEGVYSQGIITKEEFELPIMGESAVIEEQPINIQGNIGKDVVISIGARNVESYTWCYSANGGKSWSPLTGWNGYNTNTLRFQLNSYRIGLKYRCLVKGYDGKQIISNAVGITEIKKAQIIVQPTNAEGKAGDIVTFNVKAENAEGYAWCYSANGGKSWSVLTGWDGYNTDTLRFQLNSYRMGLKYRCIVKGNNGSQIISDSVGIY